MAKDQFATPESQLINNDKDLFMSLGSVTMETISGGLGSVVTGDLIPEEKELEAKFRSLEDPTLESISGGDSRH